MRAGGLTASPQRPGPRRCTSPGSTALAAQRQQLGPCRADRGRLASIECGSRPRRPQADHRPRVVAWARRPGSRHATVAKSPVTPPAAPDEQAGQRAVTSEELSCPRDRWKRSPQPARRRKRGPLAPSHLAAPSARRGPSDRVDPADPADRPDPADPADPSHPADPAGLRTRRTLRTLRALWTVCRAGPAHPAIQVTCGP